MEKVLDNILVSKRISGWLSVAGERKYGKSGAVSDKLREADAEAAQPVDDGGLLVDFLLLLMLE